MTDTAELIGRLELAKRSSLATRRAEVISEAQAVLAAQTKEIIWLAKRSDDLQTEVKKLAQQIVQLTQSLANECKDGMNEIQRAEAAETELDRLRIEKTMLVEALRIAREYVVRIDGTIAFTEPTKRCTYPDLHLIDTVLTKCE